MPNLFKQKVAPPRNLPPPSSSNAAPEETAYLLRSPENAKRLLEHGVGLKRSDGTERELAERG